MSVLVQKYGGKCVADPASIKSVAQRVVGARRAGDSVVVVMSAMGSTTDELIALAHQVSSAPSPRELDMLITVGERISMALLSMAIKDLGFDSISFTGSQSGIITTSDHNRARVVDVRPERIIRALDEGKIVIVAGFQGVSTQKEITTLGRGGSDLTAVVMAEALGATRCELRKDVPGIMSADPRSEPNARLIRTFSYDKLVELACAGASVIHGRAARFVRRKRMPVVVCSAVEDSCGTKICGGQPMADNGLHEHAEVASLDAVVSSSPVCALEVCLPSAPQAEGLIPKFFDDLSSREIVLDMVSLSLAGDSGLLSFVVTQNELDQVEELLRGLDLSRVRAVQELSKVSVIGDGFLSDPKTVSQVQTALTRSGASVFWLKVSALSISLLVKRVHEATAVRAIHELILASGGPTDSRGE